MVVWQLTENKSFKCTPIFHGAPLRKCSIIMLPLYPVSQPTCKQTILLEYKTERDLITTKLCFTSSSGVLVMNK